jgi:hypothetical protein
MHPTFHQQISAYLAAVADRLSLLQREQGILPPNSNVEWTTNRMCKVGTLSGGVKFVKHGYGCRFEGGGETVDFDFGERGEFNGFDAWRLSEYYGASLLRGIQFALDQALLAGEIERRGNLYYLRNEMPNQSTDPTSASGTSRAGHDPRHR